jgi:hypothetical protein
MEIREHFSPTTTKDQGQAERLPLIFKEILNMFNKSKQFITKIASFFTIFLALSLLVTMPERKADAQVTQINENLRKVTRKNFVKFVYRDGQGNKVVIKVNTKRQLVRLFIREGGYRINSLSNFQGELLKFKSKNNLSVKSSGNIVIDLPEVDYRSCWSATSICYTLITQLSGQDILKQKYSAFSTDVDTDDDQYELNNKLTNFVDDVPVDSFAISTDNFFAASNKRSKKKAIRAAKRAKVSVATGEKGNVRFVVRQ